MKSCETNKQPNEYIDKLKNHFKNCYENFQHKMCSDLLKINGSFIKDNLKQISEQSIVNLFKEACRCMMGCRENTNQLSCAKLYNLFEYDKFTNKDLKNLTAILRVYEH